MTTQKLAQTKFNQGLLELVSDKTRTRDEKITTLKRMITCLNQLVERANDSVSLLLEKGAKKNGYEKDILMARIQTAKEYANRQEKQIIAYKAQIELIEKLAI